MIAIAIFGITGTANAALLSFGSRGVDVSDIQIALVERGFDIPAISSGRATPGYFGEQTRNAVSRYQASLGLQATGMIESDAFDSDSLTLGAVSGPDVNFRIFLNRGVTSGGRLATSSSKSTYTTDEKDFRTTPTYLDWTPNLNTTISISATSTHAYIPNIGDVARIVFRNASSTAASAITFAALNANVDLQFVEATGGDLVLNGLDFAEIILVREDTFKTTVLFQEFIEAD